MYLDTSVKLDNVFCKSMVIILNDECIFSEFSANCNLHISEKCWKILNVIMSIIEEVGGADHLNNLLTMAERYRWNVKYMWNLHYDVYALSVLVIVVVVVGCGRVVWFIID